MRSQKTGRLVYSKLRKSPASVDTEAEEPLQTKHRRRRKRRRWVQRRPITTERIAPLDLNPDSLILSISGRGQSNMRTM